MDERGVYMKRAISLTLILIMIATLICSCSFLPDEIKTCTINFYVDGELYTTKTGVIGQVISQPKSPQKENEIFVGWFVNNILVYEYDFSSLLIGDLDLHAKFVLDGVAITNMMTTQIMKSVVTIVNKAYNTAMGGLIETSSSTSQGSGVVVDISDGYCFVLTNYHVVATANGFSKQSIKVEDPWGNEYEANVYKNKNSSSAAIDPSYDLALIYFKYQPTTEMKLEEIAFANNDPKSEENVISLGTPNGQQNSITYGKVLSYQKLNNSEDSDEKVEFDIIYHSALIYHGSSGGPLVDTSGKLVGLNFAGFENNHYGCAIPLSKIIEFMGKYVYL